MNNTPLIPVAPNPKRASDAAIPDATFQSAIKPPLVLRVQFRALDDYALGGVLYEPVEAAPPPCAVVFNCGGGLPAILYARFAAYLAGQGIPTLLYDYRGVGHSRPAHLRGFVATVNDWAEFDCGGAIAWLRARYLETEIVGVAHSVGAMLFGAAPNARELSRLVFVGAHTGYFGDYRSAYRLPMGVLWHGVMPLLTRALGYFPGRMLHLGDDLPAGVALQWAARRTPDLRPKRGYPGAERTERMLARYAGLQMPTFALSFKDDAFATAAGTRRLLDLYPGISARHEVLDPESVGLAKIGHFGFFQHARGSTLWPLLYPKILSASSHPLPAKR
jgi:predicted alpha/beta hydrolase